MKLIIRRAISHMSIYVFIVLQFIIPLAILVSSSEGLAVENATNVQKIEQLENLLDLAEGGLFTLESTQRQAIKDVDAFFMENANKPFQLYPQNPEEVWKLLKWVIEIIKEASHKVTCPQHTPTKVDLNWHFTDYDLDMKGRPSSCSVFFLLIRGVKQPLHFKILGI